MKASIIGMSVAGIRAIMVDALTNSTTSLENYIVPVRINKLLNIMISKCSKLIYTIYEVKIEDRLKFEEGVKRAS